MTDWPSSSSPQIIIVYIVYMGLGIFIRFFVLYFHDSKWIDRGEQELIHNWPEHKGSFYGEWKSEWKKVDILPTINHHIANFKQQQWGNRTLYMYTRHQLFVFVVIGLIVKGQWASQSNTVPYLIAVLS